jgi:uncharacterized membrane protein YcjF (UPF0283 family)
LTAIPNGPPVTPAGSGSVVISSESTNLHFVMHRPTDGDIRKSDTIALAGVVLITSIVAFPLGWAMAKAPTWDQIDTLTVVLAALGGIITVLGIVLAVAAFWGYTSVRQVAIEKAEAKAKAVAEEVAAKAIDDKFTRLGDQSGPSPDYGKAAGSSDNGG